MKEIDSMQKLINAFTFLPGVGQKTAERYAYKILNLPEDDVEFFSKALVEAKQNVHYCSICGNFTDKEICEICENRKSDIICVVKEPKDVVALEKARNSNCLYHVLHGTISPLENKGPNDIRIKELVERVDRKGKIIHACPDYPKCKYVKPDNIPVESKQTGELTDKVCPKCGAPLLKKKGKSGMFLGCSNYPTCDHKEKYRRNRK